MNKMNKKGFTLIEMLVVIAIIAVLVSIIVPVVGNSTTKAKAAADAANLRSVAASVAVEYLANPDATITATNPGCETFSSAKLHVIVENGSINAYYVNGSDYYGVDAFAASAKSGEAPTKLAAAPTGSKTLIDGTK